MDKRTSRLRKAKSRNPRPYDRQNQSIFGKVCSTVKGLLNPSSWFNVPQWINNSDEQHGHSSDDIEEEDENINSASDIVSQSVSNASKRLRLRLDGHNFQDAPSIQSSETQTWPEQPSQNLYETIPRVSSPSSSATQSSLLENKEVINGDDHSENSEGSASTSGCSSLVSSHKESNRLAERPFVSLLDVKGSRKRRATSPKPDFNDLNCSRGLWSSSFHNPSLKFQRRYPTVSHTNQPNFNLSSFAAPSRLNESPKKTSSPFYEGKTTFGGASALRRMPAAVTPYQVDRSLRNQIRVENVELKRMSSAAERILTTLDKISSPVSDAKRIPNTDKSPVDLSVYLTPPKSRWNSMLTPSTACKGPPIANINTIAKLATLKNYGTSRLRSTPQNESTFIEQPSSNFDKQQLSFAEVISQKSGSSKIKNKLNEHNISSEGGRSENENESTSIKQPSSNFDKEQPNFPEVISQKSGGGKIRNKLNQHHISSKGGLSENELMDTPHLKNIPLPITSLPTINFGTKPDKKANLQPTSLPSASEFTFSKPIEHDLAVNNTLPASTLALNSSYGSFKFARPIDYDLPNNSQPKEKPSPTWECSEKSQERSKSETSKETKETKNKVETLTNNNAFSTWECASCWVRNPMKEKKCMACEALNPNADLNSATQPAQPATKQFLIPPNTEEKIPANKTQEHMRTEVETFTNNNAFSTWECSSCWVRNPMKEKKCMACETLHPNADANLGTTEGFKFKFSSPLQNSPVTFKFGNYVCTAPAAATTCVSASKSQISTSGFKFDTSNTLKVQPHTSSATIETVSKTSETSAITTTDFKIPAIILSSEKTQNEKISSSNEISQTNSIFPSTTKASKNSGANKSDVIKTVESVPEPEKNSELTSKPTNLDDNSKEKLPDTVISSSSSKVPSPSVTACFGFTTKPIESKDAKGSSLSGFKLTNETSKLTTFASPVNLFKFGEKVDSPQNNLSSTSVTLTTATTTSFSFSSSGSNFGIVTNSKINELNSTVSNSHPVTIKPEENKTVTSTTISSATTSSPFVFGSSVNTSAPSGFSFFPTSSASSATTAAAASTTTTTTTSVFTFGTSSNTSGGFSFKAPEKEPTTSAVSSVSQSTPSGLNAGISTQVPSFLPPVFGTPKTEASSVMSVTSVPFTFGSGTATTVSNPSAFSAFQPPKPTSQRFQFGSQGAESTASAIGTAPKFIFPKSETANPTSSSTTTNFVFGTKNENTNQISSTVSQPSAISFGTPSGFTFSNKTDNSDAATQKPALPFTPATILPFGSTPAQPSLDKPASGGFNFVPSSAVFQFGAGSNNTDKKRTSTASGFSFGTSTPPSFNFGATSTPTGTGPFQFAASGAPKPAPALNSGPRKIRKAVRRVRGKE